MGWCCCGGGAMAFLPVPLAKVLLRWPILAAGASVLVHLVILHSLSGGEAQFSPDSFESRGVTTFSIPSTNLTLLTLPWKPYRTKIAQFWLDEGYLLPPTASARRWDVITGYQE